MAQPLILDGKIVADSFSTHQKRAAGQLREGGIHPRLQLLRVGENPASISYVRLKCVVCDRVGVQSAITVLPETASQSQILTLIEGWNADPAIHGILVQLPLPPHLDSQSILSLVAPEKDVDGLHPLNLGKLVRGIPAPTPCTPLGILEILRFYQIPIARQKVVILGRSLIVGQPLAILMTRANATVTLCHRQTPEIEKVTATADILVAAMGQPELVKPHWIRPGGVVIDVGVNRHPDPTRKQGYRLVGDVDFVAARERCTAISPVPGGVGPMTIAMLMENTLRAAGGEFQASGL